MRRRMCSACASLTSANAGSQYKCVGRPAPRWRRCRTPPGRSRASRRRWEVGGRRWRFISDESPPALVQGYWLLAPACALPAGVRPRLRRARGAAAQRRSGVARLGAGVCRASLRRPRARAAVELLLAALVGVKGARRAAGLQQPAPLTRAAAARAARRPGACAVRTANDAARWPRACRVPCSTAGRRIRRTRLRGRRRRACACTQAEAATRAEAALCRCAAACAARAPRPHLGDVVPLVQQRRARCRGAPSAFAVFAHLHLTVAVVSAG